jgi:hypothetical protein
MQASILDRTDDRVNDAQVMLNHRVKSTAGNLSLPNRWPSLRVGKTQVVRASDRTCFRELL